jgi:5'-deoxynucleotidase YfbR-like HD superfamily hydrolase
MRPSIQLASGRFFDFTSFSLKDIQIEDIASATSKLCRFTGHCKVFYSVAQHQVLVSHIVPREHALTGLLHDATEAYINDLSRPLKLIVPQYGEFEHTRLWPVIAARYDLPDVLPPCIKEADNIALVTERRDLMPKPVGMTTEWAWAKDIPALKERIKPLEDWREARALFMARYRALTKKQGE